MFLELIFLNKIKIFLFLQYVFIKLILFLQLGFFRLGVLLLFAPLSWRNVELNNIRIPVSYENGRNWSTHEECDSRHWAEAIVDFICDRHDDRRLMPLGKATCYSRCFADLCEAFPEDLEGEKEINKGELSLNWKWRESTPSETRLWSGSGISAHYKLFGSDAHALNFRGTYIRVGVRPRPWIIDMDSKRDLLLVSCTCTQ